MRAKISHPEYSNTGVRHREKVCTYNAKCLYCKPARYVIKYTSCIVFGYLEPDVCTEVNKYYIRQDGDRNG